MQTGVHLCKVTTRKGAASRNNSSTERRVIKVRKMNKPH